MMQNKSRPSTHIFKAVCFLLLFLTLSHLTFGQQLTDWTAKIHPSLFLEASKGRTVDFLIIFKDQPGTDGAKVLLNKEQKGAYVYQKLHASATKSQARVIQMAQESQFVFRSFWIINAMWAEGDLTFLEKAARLPEVSEIQTNPKVRFEGPVRDVVSEGQRVFAWGIGNIKANQVHALGYSGQGVVVAGQDTGYEWDNAAFKEKYRGWNAASKTANHNYNWHDAIHTLRDSNICGINSPVPCDDHNHGTHTMGTMVGENQKDTFGVAPGARWIACRNMDKGYGTPATYIECFEWFVAPYDLDGKNPKPELAPHVINNSWSCPESEGCNPGNFATMNTVINNVRNAGIVVVVSAGNGGSNCSTVNAPPAIFEGSFAVGASNSKDSIAGFSSRGPVAIDSSFRMKPNVSAPGVGVYSTIRKGAFATWNGTSMAGPHVAGVVALMISANPHLAGKVDLIEDILETTARKNTLDQTCGGIGGSSSPNNVFGHGIIDALEAVKQSLYLLPLEIRSFTGKKVGDDHQLNWETSKGGKLSHFVIEYARDIATFKSIGTVPFQPVLSGTGKYAFKHVKQGAGIHFYRLKLVGADGTSSYSDTVIIRIPEPESIVVFPNPATDKIQIIALYSGNTEVPVQLYNTSGSLVAEKRQRPIDGLLDLSFDMPGWATGVYFINILPSGKDAKPLHRKFFKL